MVFEGTCVNDIIKKIENKMNKKTKAVKGDEQSEPTT